MSEVIGCDFSSSPSKRKPIVIARGDIASGVVRLLRIDKLETLDAFSECLKEDRAWVGGFDLPFGLPRELVEHLGWPDTWPELIAHYASLDRDVIRATFAAFCDARPVGGKFAHRAADAPAGSSPSMKWVNPPVAFMLHAGVPRLVEAGVSIPGLHETKSPRIALEAYPGMLAREIVARRSYKSDTKAKQTPDRIITRMDIVAALEQGRTSLGLRVRFTSPQRDSLVADASGDSLDAVLCMVQASWAAQKFSQGDLRYGLPAQFDALEGWIVTASSAV